MKIIISYRGAPRIRGWETGALIAKAFRQLGHTTFEYGNIYESKERLPNAPDNFNNIDLWVYCEMNDGELQYSEVKNIPISKLVCTLYDTSYYPDKCRGLVDYFNFKHIFLANPLTIQEYKTWGYKNVHYLSYACDKELHGRPLDYTKKYEVALVGSIRDDRIKLKKELADRGINLELIGNIFREQYIDALASSRIVINQNPEAGRGLLNMRHFEAQAAGAFLIEQQGDLYWNVQSGLKTTLGCYPYTTIDDIVEICHDSLNDKKAFNDLLSNQQERFLKLNTYQNRCEQILETVLQYGSI